MLNGSSVFTVFPAKDVARLKAFFSEKFGLNPTKEEMGMAFYESGDSKFFIYPTEYAGTNQATTACFDVADIAAVVNDLKSKGVTFEHYDIPGVTMQGDVHVMEGTPVKSAWLKDTEGNIISITQYS